MTIKNVDELRNKHESLQEKLHTISKYCKYQSYKIDDSFDVDYFEVSFQDFKHDDTSSYVFTNDKGYFNMYLGDDTLKLSVYDDNFDKVLDAANENNVSEKHLNDTYDFQLENLDMTINILDNYDTLSYQDKLLMHNLVCYPPYNSEMITNPDNFLDEFLQNKDWVNERDTPEETMSKYKDLINRTQNAFSKLPQTRNQDLNKSVNDYQTLKEKHNKLTELVSKIASKGKHSTNEDCYNVNYCYEFDNYDDTFMMIETKNGQSSYIFAKDDNSFIYNPTVNDLINDNDITEQELSEMYDDINLNLEFDNILLDSLDNIDDKNHRNSIASTLSDSEINIETFDKPIGEYSNDKPYEQWYKNKAYEARNQSQNVILDMSDLSYTNLEQ